MPIHAWWERVVKTWKRFRPARRRNRFSGFSAEAFEPRRMLSAFIVNSLADTHDAIPGDGIAADENGLTTLRAALEESNALAGADTITLSAGIISLLAANGPLAVTDDVTILGGSESTIDGTALDEVFTIHNGAEFQIANVAVFSSGALPASARPTILTTNARQADLIVAFAASPSAQFVVDTKTQTGLSPLIGTVTPTKQFDELRIAPIAKSVLFGESPVPTPEQAIDQIVNALYRNEPDFVLPTSANETPETILENNSRPMSKTDIDEPAPPAKSETDTPPESMSSGDEQSFEDSEISEDDDAVGAILRGWANEAGWGEFDFLSRGSCSVVNQPRHGARVAAFAGALLSGVVAKSWSRDEQSLWRDALSLNSWRTRFERLRRRAR